MKSEQVTEDKVEPNSEVTVKKAVASKKHSVTNSNSDDVVKSKSRRLESAESGKGKKTVSKNDSDGNEMDQVPENAKVPGNSNSDGRNKENVVTVGTGQPRKRKPASQGVLTHKSSSPQHPTELSYGDKTDSTLEGEEEMFRKKFKAKATASAKGSKKIKTVSHTVVSGGTNNKQSSELQQHKEQSRASWFDPNKFETK